MHALLYYFVSGKIWFFGPWRNETAYKSSNSSNKTTQTTTRTTSCCFWILHIYEETTTTATTKTMISESKVRSLNGWLSGLFYYCYWTICTQFRSAMVQKTKFSQRRSNIIMRAFIRTLPQFRATIVTPKSLVASLRTFLYRAPPTRTRKTLHKY